MTTLTTIQPTSSGLRLGRLLIAGLLGGALAAAANTALLFAGKAAGIGFLAPIKGPAVPLQVIQPANVIIMCLAPALGAALLLALLGRFTRRPYRIFLAIAGLFLLVSFYPDWALPMDSLPTRALLSVMHLVAGVAITGALTRTRDR